MVGALIAFAVGKPYYAVEKPGPVNLTPEERRQRWETLKTLFGFFGLVVFFWFGYEHNDSLWVYFADKHMNLTHRLAGRHRSRRPVPVDQRPVRDSVRPDHHSAGQRRGPAAAALHGL